MSWQERICDLTLASTSKELTVTARSLFGFMINAGFTESYNEPNALMVDLTIVGKVNAMHLAVVLRGTFNFKDDPRRVKGWYTALDACTQACIESGRDPQIVLYGLIQK